MSAIALFVCLANRQSINFPDLIQSFSAEKKATQRYSVPWCTKSGMWCSCYIIAYHTTPAKIICDDPAVELNQQWKLSTPYDRYADSSTMNTHWAASQPAILLGCALSTVKRGHRVYPRCANTFLISKLRCPRKAHNFIQLMDTRCTTVVRMRFFFPNSFYTQAMQLYLLRNTYR